MTKILKAILGVLAVVCVASTGFAQTGFIPVSASNTRDASGNLISNATISFAPVNASGKPLSFKSASGQSVSTAISAQVTSGAFTITLADTARTTPTNVCYAATVIDNTTGNVLLSAGYGCVQMSSTWCSQSSGVNTSCNFDSYPPDVASIPLTVFPVLSIGTVQNGTPAAASFTGSYPNYLLNLTLPSGTNGTNGAPGPNCASSSPAGYCDLSNVVLENATTFPDGTLQSTALPSATSVNPNQTPRYAAELSHYILGPAIIPGGAIVDSHGDSINAGIGDVSITGDASGGYGWVGYVMNAVSTKTGLDCGAAGSYVNDMFAYQNGCGVFQEVQNTPSQAKIYPVNIGTNDSNASSTAANAVQIMDYKLRLGAVLTWLATDQETQVAGDNTTNVTTSGTAALDYTYTAVHGMQLAAAGSSVTFTVTPTKPVIYLAYKVWSGDTGVCTPTIDGAAVTDTISGNAALTNGQLSGAVWQNYYADTGTTQGAYLARFVVTANVQHSVTLTDTTNGTNGCEALYVAWPPAHIEYTAPVVGLQGVIYQQNDTSSANSAAYYGYNQTMANLFAEDGLRTYFVPVRNWINSTTDMSGSDAAINGGQTLTGCTISSTSLSCPGAHWGTSADALRLTPGKYVIVEGAGASGAALYTTVAGWVSNTALTLATAASTSVNGTATVYYGNLGQVCPASSLPGLHPNKCGHYKMFRAWMATLQPQTATPPPTIFTSSTTFSGGVVMNSALSMASAYDVTNINHITQKSVTPTMQNVSTGSGGTGSVGIPTGSDTQGTIYLTTGASPLTASTASPGTMGALLFGTTMGLPSCTFSPQGVAANYGITIVATSSGFVLYNTVTLPASTTLVLDYTCFGQSSSGTYVIVPTAFSIDSSNNLTLTVGSTAFTAGAHIGIYGAPAAYSYLNGVYLTITSVTSTTVVATGLTHAAVASTSLVGYPVLAVHAYQ